MGSSQVLPFLPLGRCQSPGGPNHPVVLQYDWYTRVTVVVVDVVPRQLGGKGCMAGRCSEPAALFSSHLFPLLRASPLSSSVLSSF